MNTFTQNKRKRSIQNLMYSYVGSHMNANILILGGPQAKFNIENGLKIAKSPGARIYLVEKNDVSFQKLSKTYESLKHLYKNKVFLRHQDVTCFESDPYYPIRCEDLDFCCTMESAYHIITYRLGRQMRLYSKGANHDLYKCIMFTVCLKARHRKDYSKERVFKLIHLIEDFVESHRLHNNKIMYWKYRDTTPMLSAAILYK